MNFEEHYLTEKFYKADHFTTEYFDGYAEIFVDPTAKELISVMKDSSDHGVRLAVSKGKIYAWTEDILHEEMERILKTQFDLKLQYTKGHTVLWLGSPTEMRKKWERVGHPLVAKFKTMMPAIETIQMTLPDRGDKNDGVVWEY